MNYSELQQKAMEVLKRKAAELIQQKTITVDDNFDPTQWEPYDCVVQVNNQDFDGWQDYATIKDEGDRVSALALVLSGKNFRVKENKCGEVKYYAS